MRERGQIVRMVSSFLACLIGALFVAGYNSIQSGNAYHRGALNDLPSPTSFYAACAPWGLLVPAAMAFGAAFLARKDRASDTLVEVHVAFGWLFALAWTLGCIVAWELPWMLIGGRLPT
jgi:hypothetical protein